MTSKHFLVVVSLAVTSFVFPVLATAHTGTGVCSTCHTMHNSEDGTAVNAAGPQPHLLKGDCVGCHVRTFNLANGRAESGIAAPQVGPQVALGVVVDSGGYFNDAGGLLDNMTHNVVDIPTVAADSLLATSLVSPGGGFATDDGTGLPVLSCTSCHDQSLGHQPPDMPRDGVTSSYRMLAQGVTGSYVIGTGNADYEAAAAINTNMNLYDAFTMNAFCANCHGAFHENHSGGLGTGDGDQYSSLNSAWIRHPTDVTTTGYKASYIGDNPVIPVGDRTNAAAREVMCISCHRPHGSDKDDLLRFTYNAAAGDGTATLGCETCHGVVQ